MQLLRIENATNAFQEAEAMCASRRRACLRTWPGATGMADRVEGGAADTEAVGARSEWHRRCLTELPGRGAVACED